MTVSYTRNVPNGSSFGCFWKILCKWKGSVYKLVWRELVAYLFLYYTINLVYRFALNEQQKRSFEKYRAYFGTQSETIPMSFVLGFYVTLVVGRWWDQYKTLPWPDSLAIYVTAAITGADERCRLMRRNIVRYAVLAYVITLMRVSLRVKRRFPTWQHVVDSGLMMDSEKKIFEMMDGKSPMSKYWMPLVWATNIINRARKESLITSDHIVQTLLTELSDIRRRLGAIIGYDTVCVPLVYTQVVTWALYSYFIAALLGRQFVERAGCSSEKCVEIPDMYFPFFTALQFCFYVGWLKVAEVLINPFGEDDDDIELNWLIDRHIKASYMIVDEMHDEHPELLKDQYWEEVVPKELPYTVASEHYRRHEPKCTADDLVIKDADAMYANLLPNSRKQMAGITSDDMYADYESVDTPIVERRKNWFARQITRMGSVRSASTAYSSGGLFHRPRHPSVYSSPEAGGQNHGHKMSLYDRLVGRKSVRGQRQIGRQGTAKLNGAPATATNVKNRPRIPTPDVTKEVVDREGRVAAGIPQTANSLSGQLGQGVTLMTGYPSDMPMVQVVLSPIQELDGSGSVNNTLHPGQPGTAALAQAVLSPALTSAGIGSVLATPVLARANVLAPVTVSQLSSLGLVTTTSSSPSLQRAPPQPPQSPFGNLTLTEVPAGYDEEAPQLQLQPQPQPEPEEAPPASRKTSVTSQAAAPTGSPKRGEVYV